MAMSACSRRQPRSSRKAREISRPSTRYSVKCASFRIIACMVTSVCGSACGNSHARNGTIIDSVRDPVNKPVDATKMTAAQATTGAHLDATPASGDKLGDRLVHERQRLFVELGVDEALDLVALRRIALAARAVGELR